MDAVLRRKYDMQNQSGSCSWKAWSSLLAIFVTHLLFAVSTSVWPQTDESLDQGHTFPAKVVYGDYDGDFLTDLVVWRPSEGNWYIIDSVDETTRVQQSGLEDDIPVPGNYDGDLATDLAVWRPSEGNWYIIKSSDDGSQVRQLRTDTHGG
jgi:hypothetical protein